MGGCQPVCCSAQGGSCSVARQPTGASEGESASKDQHGPAATAGRAGPRGAAGGPLGAHGPHGDTVLPVSSHCHKGLTWDLRGFPLCSFRPDSRPKEKHRSPAMSPSECWGDTGSEGLREPSRHVSSRFPQPSGKTPPDSPEESGDKPIVKSGSRGSYALQAETQEETRQEATMNSGLAASEGTLKPFLQHNSHHKWACHSDPQH